MAVLTTIHQPSSEIFTLFDRIIVLSEGYTIYNGPPMEVKSYFSQFGLQMANYSNPADKLSIIASVPRTVLTKDITIKNLSIECKKLQKENFFLSEAEKQEYEGKLNRRLSIIALDREVPYVKQWWLLYKRMM